MRSREQLVPEARAQARAGSRYPFLTQQERDTETNLDYFVARYYVSPQGRFISPDAFAGILTNPQTLNRYSYVGNNPLKYVDLTGNFFQDPNQDPNRPHPNTPCTREAPCDPDENDTVKIRIRKRTRRLSQ